MGLNDYLQTYQTITLEEMDKVRLMNRIDTKYITTLPNLELLLSRIVTTYRLQQIDGQTNMPYYTCYFDTASCSMFTEHQRGRKVRQKIRIREYENSRLTFLEIKNKNNKGRTDKNVSRQNVEKISCRMLTLSTNTLITHRKTSEPFQSDNISK